MPSNKSIIFRIEWKWKKERNREIVLRAWINVCSLFLSALIFSEDASYSCEHTRCRWEKYFPCKFSLYPGQAVRKWSKNGSLWIRRRPRSVRVSAVEMERMRSLRSRSVKLLPSCRNSCYLLGTVARTRHAEHVFMLSRVSCHVRN